jgi:hypothetical protein
MAISSDLQGGLSVEKFTDQLKGKSKVSESLLQKVRQKELKL